MKEKGKLAIFGGTPVRPEPIQTTVTVSENAKTQINVLIESGEFSNYYNGAWAHHFETAFARLHGNNRKAVAVNSGTSALHLALVAAGIGRGDEVIVPALCFVAAATAIAQIGALPIICDAEPTSLTMNCEHVEHLISDRTKAILPVHFWGYPADLSKLRALSQRFDICLIEDCAQAYGARVHDKLVGTYGLYATFALSVRKHIACGEGGIVLTTNTDNQNKLRVLANYGKGPGWDDYECLGFSYRLPEFSAIVALDGLNRLSDEIKARRAAANYYEEATQSSDLMIVPEPSWGSSVYFKVPFLLPADQIDCRQDIVDAINAENVSARIPHRPLFKIPWLVDYLAENGKSCQHQDFPIANTAHDRLFELESGPHLPIDEFTRSAEAMLKVWEYYG